jgi:peptidyl-prolyl cis-trans isomerase C
MPDRISVAVSLLAFAGLLTACHPASNVHRGSSDNVEAPPAASTLVTVNGQPVTTRQVDAYIHLSTRHSNKQTTPEQKRRILKELVKITLAVQAAKKEGLQERHDIQAKLALRRSIFLSSEAVQHYLKGRTPSDAALYRKYKQAVQANSHARYKLRSILVPTRAEARKIIGRLDKGTDFSALDKKYSPKNWSTQPRGKSGWYKIEQLTPHFAAAVAKLQSGDYTKTPVKTKHGWSVILLEKKRTPQPRSFATMKRRLAREAKNEIINDYFKQLAAKASIIWNTRSPASVTKAPSASASTSTGG